ncbi:hypothetical protein BBJ28_00000794 [Nothophytophthora sp. Chile5]|nr:hypothetical protein BBJ28_00000794 [Nothophytophthora sp. Chile5]
MGGGVSKSEYDRIRRELVLKDQVIRALQERLASGGHIGPMHITPPAPEHAGDDAATQAAGRVIASAMATKLREGSKVSRLSNAMPVTTATGTKGNRVSPSFAVAGDEDKLRLIGELETETASQPRTGTGRLESQGGMKGVVSTTASGKVRRVEVSAEVMPSHNFLAVQERVVYPKSESSKQLLLKVLQSNVLFQGQSRGEIHDCLDAFFPMQASPGDLVIQQGAQGDNFYAVESGQLEILVVANGAPPIRYGFLGPGVGFGELALLCNTPRAATIRAVTDVELWALERNTFREILASHKLNRLNRTLQVLHKVALLSKLTTAEMQQVAAAMDWEEFEAEAAIVRQGEVGEKFYIITKGDLVVTQLDAASGEHHTIRRLKAGDHFGEMALFKDDVRSATCTAVTRVQCVTLEREHFIAMLGTIQELMDREPAQLEAKEPSLGHKFANEGINLEPFGENRLAMKLGGLA